MLTHSKKPCSYTDAPSAQRVYTVPAILRPLPHFEGSEIVPAILRPLPHFEGSEIVLLSRI